MPSRTRLLAAAASTLGVILMSLIGSGPVMADSTPPPSAVPTPGGGGAPWPPVVDVYSTPGTHSVNGREWRTTCEPYSQTTRCRTEIKAHVVREVDGRLVKTWDWNFNNLTYLPSPHALWEGNPLGYNHLWTASDGRWWTTVCHMPETGNACRTQTRSKYIEAYQTPDGYRYRWTEGWVFNNMVRFSDPPPTVDGDLYGG